MIRIINKSLELSSANVSATIKFCYHRIASVIIILRDSRREAEKMTVLAKSKKSNKRKASCDAQGTKKTTGDTTGNSSPVQQSSCPAPDASNFSVKDTNKNDSESADPKIIPAPGQLGRVAHREPGTHPGKTFTDAMQEFCYREVRASV